ncbi:hypothetical protein IJI18_02195, partial [Candidatus Saccharibacteria bacterium]|nr:hypothetical protein [Candidatus Saccharibacteria bacterium]
TTFATGDTETYVNKWGILPSKLNSTANTDFLAAPTTNTNIIIDITSSPNTIANNYTIGLGARVDYTKPVGTYTNTYVLQAVGRPVMYTVNYLDDSPDTTTVSSTLPAPEAGPNAIAKLALSTTIPTRATYKFNKWCDGTVTHSTAGDTCSGTTYSSGADFIPTINGTNNLYAMWSPVTFAEAYQEAGKSQTSGYYKMQDMETSICANVTNDQTATLKDIRDGQNYTVAKINGNCWMTSNLLFQGTTLQSSTSNVTTTRYINGSSVKAYYNLSTQASSSSDYCYGARDYNAGTGSGSGYSKACMYYTVSDSNIGNKPNAWYNYAAATAGTITNTSNITDASESICPYGWTLPSLEKFNTITGNTYSTAFNTIFGGRWINGSLSAPDERAQWWGATHFNGQLRYNLWRSEASTDLTTDTQYTYFAYRSIGMYVRCVAK